MTMAKSFDVSVNVIECGRSGDEDEGLIDTLLRILLFRL